MQLYGRTDLVAVYYIDELSAAYSVWTGSVGPEEAHAALNVVRKLIGERRVQRLITSFEESRVPAAETPFVLAAWLGKLKTYGVRAWAHIPSRSAMAALANKPLAQAAVDGGVAYAAVTDFNAAKKWIAAR